MSQFGQTTYCLIAGFVCAVLATVQSEERASGVRRTARWFWLTAACWLGFTVIGEKTPAGLAFGVFLTAVATVAAIGASSIASRVSSRRDAE